MPNLFTVLGYHIYFWANENGEPIHVHVSKGQAVKNATKIWITSNHKTKIAHNRSRIPEHILSRIREYIEADADTIVDAWAERFENVSFYC